MQATTVKLDGSILTALLEMKPARQTLTALVRELLEAEIRNRNMAHAAAQYVAFLQQHGQEQAELDAWAAAPLERDAARARRKRRR